MKVKKAINLIRETLQKINSGELFREKIKEGE